MCMFFLFFIPIWYTSLEGIMMARAGQAGVAIFPGLDRAGRAYLMLNFQRTFCVSILLVLRVC